MMMMTVINCKRSVVVYRQSGRIRRFMYYNWFAWETSIWGGQSLSFLLHLPLSKLESRLVRGLSVRCKSLVHKSQAGVSRPQRLLQTSFRFFTVCNPPVSRDQDKGQHPNSRCYMRWEKTTLPGWLPRSVIGFPLASLIHQFGQWATNNLYPWE